MSVSIVTVVKDAVSYSGAVAAVVGAIVHKVSQWVVAEYKKAKTLEKDIVGVVKKDT